MAKSPGTWMPALTLLVYYFLIRIFETGPKPVYPWLNLQPQTALLILGLLLVGMLFYFSNKRWMPSFMLSLFALGFGTATLLHWRGLEFGSFGIYSDSWFTTAMITKFKHSSGYKDFVYKDLSAYYPSFFHYLTGRIADWTHVLSWRAFKYGGYWVSILIPFVAFRLWRKIMPTVLALLATVVSISICKHYIMFKPYEMLSLMLFVPWVLIYGLGLRYDVTEEKWDWGLHPKMEMLEGAFWGAVMFLSFYYYFFLLAMLLPIRFLVLAKQQGGFKSAIQGISQTLLILGLMAFLSSFYWFPMLLDMFRYGGESLQNRWYQPHMLDMSLNEIGKWQLFLGLFAILVMAPKNKLAQAMLMTMLAVLCFLLVGHVGMYNDFPLLHIRMVGLEEYYYNIGWLAGAWILFEKWRDKVDRSWWLAWPGLVIVLVFMNLAMHLSHDTNSDKFTNAANAKLPMLVGIEEFNQTKGKVFLTDRTDMLALKPIYSFICHNAHFSHPASQFRARLKFLKLLSSSENSDFIAWMLANNRFQAVDYVMLENRYMEVHDDNFPNVNNHIIIPIRFSKSAFEGDYFEQFGGLKEIKTCKPVPAEIWKGFDVFEMRLVALFAKEEFAQEAQKSIPAHEWKALQDEIRIRTKDYEVWNKVFLSRWGGQ